jgi:hypothetical protein
MKNLLLALLVMVSANAMAGKLKYEMKCESIYLETTLKVSIYENTDVVLPQSDRGVVALGTAVTGDEFAIVQDYYAPNGSLQVLEESEYAIYALNGPQRIFNILATNTSYYCSLIQNEIPMPEPVKVTKIGQLMSIYAIGAETTGIALRTTSGEVIELDAATDELRKSIIQIHFFKTRSKS